MYNIGNDFGIQSPAIERILYPSVTMESLSSYTQQSFTVTTADDPAVISPCWFSLPVYLYFLPAIFVLGMIGNILSIIVLSHDDVMKRTTRFLLQMLAVADIGVLVSVFFLCPQEMVSNRQGIYITTFMDPYGLPIFEIFSTISTYIVLVVTADRYVAICHPLKALTFSTMKKAIIATVCVWVGVVLFHIPMFFSLSNKVYSVLYWNIVRFLVRIMFPLTSLIFFNVKLVQSVKKSHKFQSGASRHGNRTTMMLVIVVAVFITCYTVPLFCGSLEFLHELEWIDWWYPPWLLIIWAASVTCNSVVNFIIYVLWGKRFRKILFELFKCSRCPFNKPSLTGETNTGNISTNDTSV